MLKFEGWRGGQAQPISKEELSVGAAAVSPAGPVGAYDFAWVEIETVPMRLWVDGSTPTPTSGHYYSPGVVDLLTSLEIKNLKIISVTGGTGTFRLTYYKFL